MEQQNLPEGQNLVFKMLFHSYSSQIDKRFKTQILDDNRRFQMLFPDKARNLAKINHHNNWRTQSQKIRLDSNAT